MPDLPHYSVDTSALIDWMERYYPEDCFPSLRQKVDEIVGQQRFLISDEVWEEVQKRDAKVKAWCQSRLASILVATDRRIAQEVQGILAKHERLTMEMKGRSRADPFVIAVARLRTAIVVTGEANRGTDNRPRIPYVCEDLGVPCISFLDLIRREGWRF